MKKVKHFLNMREIRNSIEQEKEFLDAIEKICYEMRNMAEEAIKTAGLEYRDFIIEPDSVDNVMDVVDVMTDENMSEDIASEKHAFRGMNIESCDDEKLGEDHILVFVTPVIEGESLDFSIGIIMIGHNSVKTYNPQAHEWEDVSDTEAGTMIQYLYNLTPGEREFYDFAKWNGMSDDEADEYINDSRALPMLYETLADQDIWTYAADANVNEDSDEDVVPALVIAEKGEAVLCAPDGTGFDIYEYDEENSEEDYIVGLVRVKRCTSANDVARYITGAYAN